MTPSTAIEGSKTFSFALPSDLGVDLPKILGKALCSGSTFPMEPPAQSFKGLTFQSDLGVDLPKTLGKA